MATYKSTDGAVFTDDALERWALEAESDTGYTGKHLGPSIPGRPISVGVQARTFTLRLDAPRRAKLNEAAHQRHITASQLVRELIDTL